jgi:hypothetical protein
MSDLGVSPSVDTLRVLQEHVGGCREELGAPTHDKCWKPTEYVIWGKLAANEALGPRCYMHAQKHVGHHALASRANYALINLRDLARELEEQR